MKIVALTLLVLTLAVAVPAEEGKKRSAEQLLTRVMRNDFLIRALRSPSTRPSVILLSVSQIESTVQVSMLDLLNRAQQWKKRNGVRYSKREHKYNLMRSTFWFSLFGRQTVIIILF